MLTDILTIIQKEMKEMLLQRGSRRAGMLNMLLMVGVFGIFVPLQSASMWFDSPLFPIMWSWMPVFMTTWMVADAVAGERERHTLETLLASRLSDRAIYLGKWGAAVLYGFSLALTNLLVAAVTVNIIRFSADGLRFYPLDFFLVLLAFTALACGLLAGLGVLISLRAATARQAYQRLSIVLLALWLPLILGMQFLPASWKEALSRLTAGASVSGILLIVSLVLLVIDAALVAAGLARFKRMRLVIE
jgi:ABC-2 type transport system permease protein